MNTSFLKTFASPSSEYRAKPFWAWNGKLDPQELRWQIRMMREMGMGGFFMHSRVGLDTKYLSDEWFQCIDACIDEAKTLGMEAWLYDEDRWPSGAGGGFVTENPQYRAKYLALSEFEKAADFKWTDSTVAAFTAMVDGAAATDVKRIAKGAKAKLTGGRTILAFSMHSPDRDSWYNNCTYLDTMNHEAVSRFIDVTHEEYRKRVGDEFGKTVPGIFTDEPNYGWVFHSSRDNRFHPATIPWTTKLPAKFRKRYGYDIVANLPKLFFDVDGEGVTPARHDYHDCITFLFTDAFGRQIGQWCDANGIAHTGHVMHEETPSSQSEAVGSSMRFYEHMQTPGMDILTQFRREYMTAKQVSSAARQFGRKWRLTETYGCTGWDFSFAGHKALGDWQAALGINLRCQHLAWYTMQGEAKRDYPATISYQSPWWQAYSEVEDYFARIHATMTKGTEVRDLLIIHPLESTWVCTNKDARSNPELPRMSNEFAFISDSLLAANIDHDYGDEDILARHARVSSARSDKQADKTATFIVGKARYKTVLVPPMVTIRSSTLALLQRFRKAGGTVVFAETPSKYVDAIKSDDASTLATQCMRTGKKDIAQAVESTCRRVSITSPDGKEIAQTLHLLREDNDAFYLFICNTGHNYVGMVNKAFPEDTHVTKRTDEFDHVCVTLAGGCDEAPVELDPRTGDVQRADAKRSKAGWNIQTSLPQLGSRLFVIPKKASTVKIPVTNRTKDVSTRKLSSAKWDILLSEDNVLVLDRPELRIAGKKTREFGNVLKADREVRKALNLDPRGGDMVQPWVRKKNENPKSVSVELAYEFDIKTLPSGNLKLGIECPELYQATINDQRIALDCDSGWWCDKSLRTIPISPASLRIGRNELKLTCDYNENHPGLEIVYLLGSFGVKVAKTNTTLTAQPTSLKLGDWTKQGLAFYSGSVSYVKPISPKLTKSQRLVVRVADYDGTAIRVLVNGQSAGITAWAPHEVDITDLLTGDTDTLAIEVISHRRNSHGPLHPTEKVPFWSGPELFTRSGDEWTDNYMLVPCGLKSPPQLIVRK